MPTDIANILSIISPENSFKINMAFIQYEKYLPSVFSVESFAITQSCWEYVVISGVLIVKGPVAISFLDILLLLFFGRRVSPSTIVVRVIGGPRKHPFLFTVTENLARI